MGGLHDHRDIQTGLTHKGQNAKPVEVGHDQVENDAIDAGIGPREKLNRCVPAFGEDCPIAETLDHGFEQATLNRIVIDDQHNF